MASERCTDHNDRVVDMSSMTPSSKGESILAEVGRQPKSDRNASGNHKMDQMDIHRVKKVCVPFQHAK